MSYISSSDVFKISDFSKINTNNNTYHVVENIDCIESADILSKDGKSCILNMASYKRPGGGVRRGAMAQEEELCRRSNLIFGISESHYPLEIDDYLYTENVTFFKNKYYRLIDPFKCDVITIPALNLNSNKISDVDFLHITRQKIKSILITPHKFGCRNLILSAFGCGVYKNDPDIISKIFKEEISLISGLYDNITFAILNDRNSNGNNFEIFKINLCQIT